DLHFKWMKDYGIDGVAVQRFIGNIGNSIINSPNATPLKLKQAAEANGRIFYICYDISSSGLAATWTDIIKFDWVYNVEQNNNLTSSPAYAKVGNKPVVQLWGPGFLDEKHPGTAAETIALIEFLQARGCYVVGGTPKGWRTNSGDAKGPTQPLPINQESFADVYVKYNMISPWMPGRIRNNTDADNLLASTMTPDKTYCDARNIQYMPVLFPGFGWSQWNEGSPNSAPRAAGEFMWHQATNIKKLGVSNMYFAMFDEYDEGTAIMKNATDWSMIPTDQYFLTSSADGLWCSSDFQLRVAGAAVKMLKETKTPSATVPVPHSNGPVYYRNSFEKRTTSYNYLNDIAQNTGTFNIDPCFYMNSVVLSSSVSSPVCEIQTTNPRSGLYSVKTSGTISANSAAKYIYKIANTKIAVTPNMRLSFWKKTENELGRYVFVDLRSKKGLVLKGLYNDQTGTSMSPATAHGTVGAGWEQFTCQFGNGVLLGDTIVEVYINYEGAGSGTYSAYFDDFLIEDGQNANATKVLSADEIFVLSKQSARGLFTLKMNVEGDYLLQVYTLSGVKLSSRKYDHSEETLDLSAYKSGVYLLNIILNTKRYHRKIAIY
ncbi:MAG: T9SS type A sorting domain-containing protein, partial [Bacteroidia bacterium]|nr:T9SS type A sorting domain-containing protein [Bacteroidia bacterium]